MPPKELDLERKLFNHRKIDEVTGCWRWTGAKNIDGYGIMIIRGVKKRVHRLSYELYKGPIFEMALHILECPYKDCFNPDHLKDGGASENARDSFEKGDRIANQNVMKTHCPRGHKYTKENTWIGKKGDRNCRACNREKTRLRRGLFT